MTGEGPMDEGIASHYRWEVRDAINAAAAVQRYRMRGPILRLGKYFAVGLLVLFAASKLLGPAGPLKNGESPALSVAATLLGIGTVLYLCSPKGLVNRWWIRYRIRSIPEDSRSVEWSFDDEMLRVRTPLSESNLRWELFKTVVESPDCFLFYQGDLFAFWIPGHGFCSPQAIRRFADLARTRVPHYVTLGECRYPAKPGSSGQDDF